MICQNCQDADIRGALEKNFYIDPTGAYYPRVRRKSNHDILWELKITESCQFCSFLRATCKVPETFDDNRNKHIYPTANSRLFLLWVGYYYGDNFHKFGAIRPGQKDEITAQDGALYQKPPLINCYDRIRNYISTCQSSHGAKGRPSCQNDDDMPLLAPLKVLDCQTRNIVKAPSNCRYLALSYVWGSKTSSFDGLKYPATIEDAITVTLRSSYRYLWVDQYCISQNSAEKMIHTQQMDRIYRNAEACIIAAAGDYYNHGLPGVNSPRHAKSTEHGVQVDGLTLLKYDRLSLDSSICESKWWQRGWTFQELLFARRRIYFTDNEVEVNFEQYESARPHLLAGDVAESSIQSIHLVCQCVPIQIRWVKSEEVRVFIGQDRNFWFDCLGISLRTDMDIAFGQGPQHTINCVGLCLDDVDSSKFQNNLLPAGMNWTDGKLSEYVLTISRCQPLIYNMGNHWERVGGFFFTNYFKSMPSCRQIKEAEPREAEPREDVYEDDYSIIPNRSDYEKWWKTVSVETQKFRLG